MKLHDIPRIPLDSGVLKSAAYDAGTLIIEFHNGSIFAYRDVPVSLFEAFGRAESRGRFYAENIKGKISGTKLTGACPQCGSKPEIIGETCSDCGVGVVVALVSKREAKRYGG